MFFKIIALKSLQISQKITCVGVFFNKVAGPQNCYFIKKRLQHRFFPVKVAKFLRAPCFNEHLQWLLLKVSGFQPATLWQRNSAKDFFSVNFAKLSRTSFLLTEHLRMTACVYLWILRSFSEHFFAENFQDTAISCTSCGISTTRYSKKLFHRCCSSILYKIER